jgi:hypothetical protein
MFRSARVGACYSVVAVGLAGCATPAPNLAPAFLLAKPSVRTFRDPSMDARPHRTFSVFPLSAVQKPPAMGEIMEQQMLFFLRNLLEGKGYVFVEPGQHPDMFATILVKSEYHDLNAAPELQSVPVWHPDPPTMAGASAASWAFSATTSGSSGWGTWSGTTSSFDMPGSASSLRVSPGYKTGANFVTAQVSCFDASSNLTIWFGSGLGLSVNPDARISSQLVVFEMMAQFPWADQPWQDGLALSGQLGMDLTLFTTDGINYWPTVTRFAEGSPACGPHKLAAHDVILIIDGVSVANMSLREVARLLVGDTDTSTRLEVWRAGERLEVILTRVDQSETHWRPTGDEAKGLFAP